MVSIQNLKTLRYQTFWKKALVFSIIGSKSENENEKIFKEGEPTEILKFLGLVENIQLL